MTTPIRILLCRCSQAARVNTNTTDDILATLAKCNSLVTVVDDLCGLAANKNPLLAEIAAAPQSAVIACHKRAVRWLFSAAGFPLDETRTSLHSLRNQNADEIMGELNCDTATGECENQVDIVAHDSDWPPWFPVIDRDRCVNCMQCLNFCLFGTYSLSDDKEVIVAKPSACKNLCPACARICPKSAIIFPKYEQAPIDGDDVPDDFDGPQVDLDAIKQGDVYARLRQRSGRQRFSPDRDGEPAPTDIAARLDVPPEVIAAMSPEELRKICNQATNCDAPNCDCNATNKNDQEKPETNAD
jgi:NAD-dependent dihydropyrimidine dehydrogenase PreA subunit